jgi:hypothetical protein
MTRKLIALVICLLAACGAAAAQGKVTFKEQAGKVDVEIDGQALTTYYYDTEWPKPFLHPLRTSGGAVVTRGFPLEKVAGESTDHHWHRGLWFAHGDINGVDFWRETSGDPKQDAKLPLPVGRLVAKSRLAGARARSSPISTSPPRTRRFLAGCASSSPSAASAVTT